MNILITGVQNIVKESVAKLALERMGRKSKTRILSFSDFVSEKGTDELHMLKDAQKRLTDKIQMKLLDSSAQHTIINGYCTVRTGLGYVPVITRESMGIFNPDFIVHIETDPLAPSGKIKDTEGFREHQSVERAFAIILACESGAGIRIIKSGVEGARKGSEELFALLKKLMVLK